MRRSWLVFEEPIRSALHHMKYKSDLGLGDALAYPLMIYLKNLNWAVDAIIPIPLSANRLQSRGYNQVGLVAFPLALGMKSQYLPKGLKRRHDTRSQVGLTASERRENVKGVFSADPKLVANRNILILDDVTTTGATLSSASQALLDAGASKIYALTIAQALAHHGLHIA
jgi:ComF family protein